MRSYIKRILGRFVKPAVIKRCVDVCSIKYTDVENQLTGMLSYRLNSIQLLYVYTCKAKYNVDKNNINVNKVDTILCFADGKLGVGFTTGQTLKRKLAEGGITNTQVKKFYAAVRAFFVRAVEYAIQKLPLNEPLLEHATFVDFKKRETSNFVSVQYFVQRYVCVARVALCCTAK